MARFRAAAPARRTKWLARASGALNATITNDTVTQVDIIGEDPLETMASPTIIRIRGTLWFGINPDDSNWQAGESADIFWALGLARGDETLAESLAGQDGQEQPWMTMGFAAIGTQMHGETTFTSAGALTTAYARAFAGENSYRTFEVDVRSMRKVRQNQKLVLAITHVSRAGTPNVLLRGMLRVLVKE